MDLSTSYMGLKLHSPLIASASPLSEKLDNIKRMEDAGAGAVVLFSLFEEQLRLEQQALHYYTAHGSQSFAEALNHFPQAQQFHSDSHGYLDHIRRAKESVHIPIIASLNGSSLGGWTRFARQIQEAGADALELNIYNIPMDLDESGEQIEQAVISILKAVRLSVTIPVSVKLTPFYSNMGHMARRIDQAGADGLTLFNRFYQPDVDLETLEVVPRITLSSPHDMRLPLRWVAILNGRVRADLAASGGVHSGEDALKMLLAGATVIMLTSALLKNGVEFLRTIEHEFRNWLEEHRYESVEQARGSLSWDNADHSESFERGQYLRALTTFNL